MFSETKDPAHSVFIIKGTIINFSNVESIFDSDDNCLCVRFTSGHEMFFKGVLAEDVWSNIFIEDIDSHK